jgi:TPR repeat protein
MRGRRLMMAGLVRMGLGGALAICLAGAAAAGPFEDGQAAYASGDYQGAVQIWRPLAERGDPRAEYMLGLAFNLGRGVTRNDATAVAWYRKAAEQGLAAAAANLGAMYANGESVPQDYAQAITWWRKASN